MKAYVRKEKEEGVSPVIATILMVAITVVLAATLYLMVGNMGGQQNVTEPIQFNAHKNKAHKWTLDVSANNLNPAEIKYAITGGVTISGQPLGADGTNDTNGVTWYDLNKDGKLNTGDQIVIWNSSINSGDTFKIVAGATGSVDLP